MQREFSHAFAKIYRRMTMDSRLPTACAGVSAMQLSIILDVIGTPTPEEVVLLHSLAYALVCSLAAEVGCVRAQLYVKSSFNIAYSLYRNHFRPSAKAAVHLAERMEIFYPQAFSVASTHELPFFFNPPSPSLPLTQVNKLDAPGEVKRYLRMLPRTPPRNINQTERQREGALGSGLRYMICVTLFCTLRNSENTQTSENCTHLCNSRMPVCFLTAQRAKMCDKI